MVWFSDFKDIFQDLSKTPQIPSQKDADIAATKADAAARAKASHNQPDAPHPEPVKSAFSAGNPASQLRQLVK